VESDRTDLHAEVGIARQRQEEQGSKGEGVLCVEFRANETPSEKLKEGWAADNSGVGEIFRRLGTRGIRVQYYFYLLFLFDPSLSVLQYFYLRDGFSWIYA
jgi:hypothetical protein